MTSSLTYLNELYLLGKDLSSVEVIVADIKNNDSIKSMCAKGRVILNCVGPVTSITRPYKKNNRATFLDKVFKKKCRNLQLISFFI